MDYLLSKKYDGTYTINFIGTETLSFPTGNTLKMVISSPISGMESIDRLDMTVQGVKSWQYLKLYFKYKNVPESEYMKCGDCWSDLIALTTISGSTVSVPIDYSIIFTGFTYFSPTVPFDFELYIYRVDDPPFDLQHPRTNIYISNITLTGKYDMDWTDGNVTVSGITPIMVVPKDIFKIFSVSDFQIIGNGNISNLNIKYRVTQNEGRTYSNWEPLTKENISTYKFNELRFARVEYLITPYTDDPEPATVYDIVLIGDFQNVSANYLKTNRYGIRQDCLTTYFAATGTTEICGMNVSSTDINNPINWNTVKSAGSAMSEYDLNMNFYTQGLSCYSSPYANPTSVTTSMTAQNEANSGTYWKPYSIDQIMSYANMLANQVNTLFAWDVDYHLTDPDKNGTDFILHEYQLKNIIDVKSLKVIVPENKFPDNQLKANTFNLDLFDVFEIQILKDEFKRKFGIDKRPSEDDILFMCPLNRLYYVKSANVFRDIMNAGIYYKVMLEKYEQKANIINLSAESKFKLGTLTKNTTMEELFGNEIKEDSDKIANKEQFKPFTFDPMRYVVNNKVIRVRQDIWNGNINFAINYYNFKDTIGKQSVIYKKTDNIINVSDNRSFMLWFNFNNGWDQTNPNRNAWKYYDIDQTTNFTFLNNFDDINKTGYKIWYFKKDINFQINDKFYKLTNLSLLTNIWYGLVVIVDQRQRVLEIKVYSRDNDYNITFLEPSSYQVQTISWLDTTGYTSLISSGFKPVDNTELHSLLTTFRTIKETFYDNIEPQSFQQDVDMYIPSSNIKYTNLRVFNDTIPTDEINNTLNENIIRNADKLILTDNADKSIYTENFVNLNWT